MESGFWALESEIQLKESRIPLTFGIRNPLPGIPNPQRGIWISLHGARRPIKMRWKLKKGYSTLAYGSCTPFFSFDHILTPSVINSKNPKWLACSAGVFFRRTNVFAGEKKGGGGGGGREREEIFFLPSPPRFPSFVLATTQSSPVIKSKVAATTIRTWTSSFDPPKIRLHCRIRNCIQWNFRLLRFWNRFLIW